MFRDLRLSVIKEGIIQFSCICNAHEMYQFLHVDQKLTYEESYFLTYMVEKKGITIEKKHEDRILKVERVGI